MQYRKLGINGPEIPVVGFGGWPIGEGMGRVDEKTALETVQSALDRGLTLIDTAPWQKATFRVNMTGTTDLLKMTSAPHSNSIRGRILSTI